MSLMEAFMGGELNLDALGQSESFFTDLYEYQALSAALRDVVEKVAGKMEANANA